MGRIQWGRVVLSGLLAGIVLFAIEMILPLAFVGRNFVKAAPNGPPGPSGLIAFLLLSFLIGIWIVWLYAAIRPRYGPGPRTALIAGLATSVLVILVDCVWAWLGFVRPAMLVIPAAGAVPIFVGVAMAGAWSYKE